MSQTIHSDISIVNVSVNDNATILQKIKNFFRKVFKNEVESMNEEKVQLIIENENRRILIEEMYMKTRGNNLMQGNIIFNPFNYR